MNKHYYSSHIGALVRQKMLRGLATANDPQPWRCGGCGEPVSHVNFTHCRCTRRKKA